MKDIVIAGRGGLAREIEWLIKRINEKGTERWNILGFITDEIPNEKTRVIGNDSWLAAAERELYAVIAIGNPKIRESVFKKYACNPNLGFPSLIDPSVTLSSQVKLGQGNSICAGTSLTVDIEIGDFNIINPGCTIGHDVRMENFVTLSPGVNISGNVYMENLSEIGTGVQIIQGKRIGKGAVIGAGAVVISDMPEHCTAVGVPAKVIKYHE